MQTINQNKISEPDPENSFDALCQGFDGGHFYGLEYILDDFFQNTSVKPQIPVRDPVDWFGLNS